MATFGVIAEGPCDQRVIENVLIGYFGDQEEPVVNSIQPPRRMSRADPSHGGWTLVFESLRRGDPESALQFNDYLVIHIDTDVQEEPGFDVPRRQGGGELSPHARVERVVAKLASCIETGCFGSSRDRILFAVAVDSIECWLMPLLFPCNKAGKITGCLEAANRELRRTNRDGLSSGTDTKFPNAYEAASRDFCNQRELMARSDKNPSLKLFIEQLDALRARMTGQDPTTTVADNQPG